MKTNIRVIILSIFCTLSIRATTAFDLTKLPQAHSAIKDKKRELSGVVAKFKTESSKLLDQRKKITTELQKHQDLKAKLENEANAIAQTLRTVTESVTKHQKDLEALTTTVKTMRATALPIISSKRADAQKAIDAHATTLATLQSEAGDQTDKNRLSNVNQAIERDAAELKKEIVAAGQIEIDTIAP
jgi:chromosome segregation ATPase